MHQSHSRYPSNRRSWYITTSESFDLDDINKNYSTLVWLQGLLYKSTNCLYTQNCQLLIAMRVEFSCVLLDIKKKKNSCDFRRKSSTPERCWSINWLAGETLIELRQAMPRQVMLRWVTKHSTMSILATLCSASRLPPSSAFCVAPWMRHWLSSSCYIKNSLITPMPNLFRFKVPTSGIAMTKLKLYAHSLAIMSVEK